MTNILLSIILPVYNVAPYLPRCLNSLMAQGLKSGEYEILLIDDGSTDESLRICEEFALKYPPLFRIIQKENEGVSATRNLGIKEAKGEYIYFVDPDDYLAPQGLGRAMGKYIDESVDILQISGYILKDSQSDDFPEEASRLIYDGCPIDSPEGWWCNAQPCNIIIKKSFLHNNNINFRSDIHIQEDMVFNLEMVLHRPHIRIVSDRIYRYILRTDSASQQRSPEHLRKLLPSFKKVFSRFADAIDTHKTNSCFTAKLSKNLSLTCCAFYSRLLGSKLSVKEYRQFRKEIAPYLHLAFPSKVTIIIRLLLLLPALTYPLLSWMYRNQFLMMPQLKK